MDDPSDVLAVVAPGGSSGCRFRRERVLVDQFIDSTGALGDRGALRGAVAAMLHLAS